MKLSACHIFQGLGVRNGKFHEISCQKRCEKRSNFWGWELNTNFNFSNFSGAPGMSRQKSGISRQKKGLLSSGFEWPTELFCPHPFTWEDPQPTRRYLDQTSLGLGCFFFPEYLGDAPEQLNRDMLKPFGSHTVFSVEFLVVCLRLCTGGFKGVSFRETHLWEHFGRTDKIASKI